MRLRNTLIGWSFIAPNFLGFAVFTLVPVLILLYVSFTSWNIFGKAPWVGVENFTQLLATAAFTWRFSTRCTTPPFTFR
ncbi:hypothetical protein [Microbacterium sp. NPDC056052]|uniref:hypothetical protein n=1 Tax=Microbacterium sp. NPDC056052 TaxID=3345695 RepID=UPI0035D78D98